MQFIPLPLCVLKEEVKKEKRQHNIGEKKRAAKFPKMNYPLNESTLLLVTGSSQHMSYLNELSEGEGITA